jgi:RNA recognition motif-containing protein
MKDPYDRRGGGNDRGGGGGFGNREALVVNDEDNPKLFLGGMIGNESEDKTREIFGEFGEIKDINIREGFGFVEFTDPSAAAEARS